jgi:hypothetical protein
MRKIAMDVLKLVTMQRNISSSCHTRFMLIVPEELARRLAGKRWIHEALRLVEIVPVWLLNEERAKLNAATALQVQGQARIKGNKAATSTTPNGASSRLRRLESTRRSERSANPQARGEP